MAQSKPFKSVTFTDPVIMQFEGNIYKHAICLGDVDNDGLNELVVGSQAGDLAVFKGGKSRPVRVASGLGPITSVAVGDLFNIGRKILVVVSSCGSCYIFDFYKQTLKLTDVRVEIKPILFQEIPPNIKKVVIGDINDDGHNEMVVALTDRILRTYEFVPSETAEGNIPVGRLAGQNKWEFGELIGGIALNRVEGMQTIMVSQSNGGCFAVRPPEERDSRSARRAKKSYVEFESMLDSQNSNKEYTETQIIGDIEVFQDQSFQGFLTASSVTGSSSFVESTAEMKKESTAYALSTEHGLVMLVRDRKVLWKTELDQPVKFLAQLLIHSVETRMSALKDVEEVLKEESSEDTAPQDDIGDSPFKSRGETPLKYGNKYIGIPKTTVPTPAKKSIPIPNVKFKRISNKEKYGVSLTPVVVAFMETGSTYFLNVNDGSSCEYKFHECVSASTAGFFGCYDQQVPCVVYATMFSNEIYLYLNVGVALNTRPSIIDLLKKNDDYVNAIKRLGLSLDHPEILRKLNRFLLYGHRILGRDYEIFGQVKK